MTPEEYKKLRNAPPVDEREKMVIAFMEGPEYTGNEFDQNLVNIIRKGMAIFIYPDLFQITKEGSDYVVEAVEAELDA